MTVLDGDCNQLIVERVVPVVRAAYRARGFALLDPYTMNLDWATIEAIARTNAFEILVNLPTMAFNRGVLHNNIGTVAPKQVERLTRAWGSDEWLDDLYEERQGLWESRRVKLGPTGAARLGRMFKERLAREFPFVSEPLVVPNTAGTPIYCLIFAGPNETGWKIASDVFRKPIQLPELLPLPSPQMMTLPFGDAV
jgi:three-Cys-motif partner protein